MVKIGTGTLVITGTNSYTGPTTLAAGMLEVDGSIASSSLLTLNTGTTLTGNGAVGELAINTGSTLSPGSGIAALNTGDIDWRGVGTYNWQMYDAGGAAGTGYDVVNVNGALDLTSTTSITVNVMSLSSTAPETSGPAINFNNAVSHSWTLVHTTDGVIRFNASKFNVVTNGFYNSLGTSRFVVQVMGGDLVLSLVAPLTVITEPATGVSASNAVLNANVSPNGAANTVYFQWGLTAAYGSVTPSTGVGTSMDTVVVSSPISTLLPGTTYHYQAVATNSAGIALGGDATFMTLRGNANLAGLTLSAASISPAFDSNVTSYTASVGNVSTNVTITPSCADGAETIQVRVNGGTFTAVASGAASGSLPLNVGANAIDVKVIAQDGFTTRIYTATVTRAPSSNALMAGLTMSAAPISPAFDSSVTSYSADAGNSPSITITPTAADITASVLVQVNGGPFTVTASGVPSGSLALNVGGNIIGVRIVAQDGVTTMDYTLSVTREGTPSATTLPATAIAVSNATLNASASPNGLETTVYFQWGTTAGYGNRTTPTDIGNGTSTMGVNVGLTNLLPGTTYHFTIVASNSVGVVTGADASFTTPALAPLATTLPATSVAPTSAGLNGTVNPDGAATTAYFQWGTNTSYGSTTAPTSAGSGNGNVAIHTTLANLLPGTMYHYTVAASNSVGAVTDGDVTFITPAASPTATTLPASGIAVSNATLNASINPNGAATTVYFQWGTTTDYGNTTPVTGIDGRIPVVMGLAARMSYDEHRPVRLDEVPDYT